MRFKKGVANLIQGVSEQSDFLRDDSQVTGMNNFIPDAAEGLTKRLGTRYLGTLPADIPENSKVHLIDRDEFEKYLLVITPSKVRVFDTTGTERTVTNSTDPYIQTANPERDLAILTVADHTWIVNKTRETATEKLPQQYWDQSQGMVFVKQGGYSITYKIFLKVEGAAWAEAREFKTTTGYKESTTSPPELDPEALEKITTTYIAGELNKSWTATPELEYYHVVHGNLIHIERRDGKPFSIRTEDGLGDAGIRPLKVSTTSVTDLPAEGIEGFRIKITGAVSTDSDDYYVAYTHRNKDKADPQVNTSGAWLECEGFGQREKPLASTMPHILESNADGTFTLRAIDWKERNAGDSESNPQPSFTDNRINDVFFYSNRLCFLTDETVIFSRANDYHNFYRRSVRSLLPDDVIDIQPDTDRITFFHSASTFQGNLYLISSHIQFKLTNTGALTPSNIQIRPMSYFHIPPDVSAVSSGKLMFIPEMRMGYSGIREFYLDTINEMEDSTDATSHVPSYIEGRIDQLAISIGKDTLLVRTDKDNKAHTELYMHRFLWRGNEKLQAAWSKVTFNAPVKYFINFDNKFLLVLKRNGLLVVEEWSPAVSSFDLQDRLLHNLPARLDSLEYVPKGDWIKQWTANHKAPLIAFTLQGDIIETQKDGWDQLINLQTEKALQDFIIGYGYTAAVTLTKLRLKDKQGKPILDTRMQIHKLFAQVIESGALYCHVTAEGKAVQKLNANAYRMGSANLKTNTYHTRTEVLGLPIHSQGQKTTITLSSPDTLPLKLDALEWSGTARKQTVTYL